MPQIAQYIGGAGTGKTRHLLEVMERVVERLHDPHLIGFVSFTRAACDEAADRAAERFDVPRADLRGRGWFRTIHGVAHRCLGIGKELLTDSAESSKWLQEALQVDAAEAIENLEEERPDVFQAATTDAGRALALWNAARNRLEPLETVWSEADDCDSRTPDYETCVAIVERYEQAKRLDGRCDFVDLLCRFAGYRLTVDGAERRRAEGEPPRLPVWIHDEMQDSSRLLDACFRRLIETDQCRWVYLAGDPFQAIYGWAGGSPTCFLNYPDAKRRIMPRSYRCPAEILGLGEAMLSDCTDYWDRRIEPACPGGEIYKRQFLDRWVQDIDPRESWLLLARTNYQAGRLARRLDEECIPWLPTKKTTGGRWKSPVRNLAIKALMNIQAGAPIDGREWQAVLKHVPSKADGLELLVHGTKSRFSAMEEREALDRWAWVPPDELSQLGATGQLLEVIRSGQWEQFIEGAPLYRAAVDRWGQEAVDEPRVRVGTVHSAKGAEADHVAILTTISAPCAKAASTDGGRNEEQRVKYVGVTRARQRLVILSEHNARFRWRIAG